MKRVGYITDKDGRRITLLEAMGDYGNVQKAYNKARKCKRHRKDVLIFTKDKEENCSGRRIRHGAGSNTYPDRRGSGSRRGGKRQNSPYTFQSGKSGLHGNCAGTHRHRGRNDNRRHCSTERSIKAV